MKAKITSVTFDFSTDYPEFSITEKEQRELVSQTVGTVYQVDDEDEIADAISDDTDWLVSDFTYSII